MGFDSTTIVLRVILWSTLLHTSTEFSFDCNADYTCTIRNWNPSEEGTFVLDHIPSTHIFLELQNLLISSTTSKLFDIFETSRHDKQTSLVVKKSTLRNFVLENGATFYAVQFENTFLSSILFGKNCSVTNLKIKRSKLAHLPISIRELNDLNVLTISHSLIQTVNLNVIAELHNLTLLDLSKNRIHSLYCTLQETSFPTLADVYFRDNRLRSINLNIFNAMKFLEKVDLSHNLISAVSGTLLSSGLHYLDLSFNRLLKVDCCKWVVPNINSLQVNNNLLTSLPSCLEQTLVNLSYVNFDYNHLHLDELSVFGRFQFLSHLTLTNNKLTRVTLNNGSIPPNMNLLSLSKNRLTRLEIPYVPNKYIVINVSSNCISSVDWDKVSTNLTKLEMARNPLECNFYNTPDCDISTNYTCKENKKHDSRCR